jgi:transposase-like protein
VKKLSSYSSSEKIEMLRQVIVDCLAVKDVAHTYAVKPNCLSQMICRAKKNKNYINLMIEKQEEHIHHKKIVMETVIELSTGNDLIASASQLRDLILKNHELDLAESFITSVLK